MSDHKSPIDSRSLSLNDFFTKTKINIFASAVLFLHCALRLKLLERIVIATFMQAILYKYSSEISFPQSVLLCMIMVIYKPIQVIIALVKCGELNLSELNIVDAEIPYLCYWLERSVKVVKTLNLSHNKITSTGAIILFNSLSKNSEISNLHLQENLLDDNCMESLGKYLKSNPYVKEVDIVNDDIDDDGLKVLNGYLYGNETLRSLILVPLNPQYYKFSIIKMVSLILNSRIERYSYNDFAHIYNAKLIVVASLKNRIANGNCASISIWCNDFIDDDLIQLADIIKNSENINKFVSITVGNCSVTSVGLIALFNSLHHATSLKEISFLPYIFNDSCIIPLSELIWANESLQAITNTVPYAYVGATKSGLELLAERLAGNTSLKRFIPAIYYSTDESYANIFKLLVSRTGITFLHIPPDMIKEEDMREIQHLLSIPVEQREIPIFSNAKSAAKSTKW